MSLPGDEQARGREERFLSRASELPATLAMVWEPARATPPRLVASAGHAIADLTGPTGARVVLVTTSHATDRAQRLLDAYERDPRGFRPARDTLGSFLIVDAPQRRILLGRDRTAVQHLYASWCGETLAVSTRQQPFFGTYCERLDPLGCELYLAFNTVAPFPLYAGLKTVPTGHFITIDAAASSASTPLDWGEIFWEIQPTEVPDSYDLAVERYGELLLASIEDTLEGSSAGLLLSGGSDSACVLGALCRLGVEDIRAVHMHTDGQLGGDFALVKALEAAFDFDLEIVDPCAYPGSWIEWVDSAIDRNSAGSYDTFPAFRLLGERLEASLASGSTVYNGEMCLLDQGFNEAASRTRHLRRALFKGPWRWLASAGPIVPSALRRISASVGRGRSKPAAALEAGLEFLHSIGRPSYYFAGLKVGLMGMPGAPRAVYRFTQGAPWDTPTALAERYFSRWIDDLTGPHWLQTMGTLANAWYSETSNFTMSLRALDESRHGLCFPFSSVALMDFAMSIPDAWARDKKIQKDMSYRVLQLPERVAYHQKDHSHVVPPWKLTFDQASIAHIVGAVRGHDFGPFQEGVSRRLAEMDRGDRPYDIIMFRLYCLTRYEAALTHG